MHVEVEQFVGNLSQRFPEYFKQARVLEVGSLNINGSVRQFFTNCNYTGLDLAPGRDVDVVCPIHEYFKPNQFDVVISTEMLEHDRNWKESLKQMYQNLKPGGLLILTCAGPDRPEHGTTRTSPVDSPFTNDYYRNISHLDFLSVLGPDMFEPSYITYERGEQDLLFYGFKK